MYCIVWRHYNADGLTPYVISKFPDKEEIDAQPELAPLFRENVVLRPRGASKSLEGKDTDKYRDVFKSTWNLKQMLFFNSHYGLRWFRPLGLTSTMLQKRA